MWTNSPTLDAIRTRIIYASMLGIAAVAWLFLVLSEREMQSMQGESPIAQLMPALMMPGNSFAYLSAAGLMWAIMIVAMMTPAVMVTIGILQQANLGGERKDISFVTGYLLVWIAASTVGAVLQWKLHSAGWLHGYLLAGNANIAGALLFAAGIYQLTPLKEACLSRCRSPLAFLFSRWPNGWAGTIRMGFIHGLYCIGCCWMLMALMFAGGVMSVLTMAALCGLILLERTLPNESWASRLPGVGLLACGFWVFIRP